MPIKVFLSHNSGDKPAVEALALRLRKERDIEPWLDKWNLIPGQPWQEELEVAIRACDCCAIFIGRGDPQKGVLGPWQNAELRALISRQIWANGYRRNWFSGESGHCHQQPSRQQALPPSCRKPAAFLGFC